MLTYHLIPLSNPINPIFDYGLWLMTMTMTLTMTVDNGDDIDHDDGYDIDHDNDYDIDYDC